MYKVRASSVSELGHHLPHTYGDVQKERCDNEPLYEREESSLGLGRLAIPAKKRCGVKGCEERSCVTTRVGEAYR